jgi:hypothetical protein
MAAIRSSETSFGTRPTLRHVTEDVILQNILLLWKEAVMTYFQVLSTSFSWGGTEENHEVLQYI